MSPNLLNLKYGLWIQFAVDYQLLLHWDGERNYLTVPVKQLLIVITSTYKFTLFIYDCLIFVDCLCDDAKLWYFNAHAQRSLSARLYLHLMMGISGPDLSRHNLETIMENGGNHTLLKYIPCTTKLEKGIEIVEKRS